MDEVRSEMVVCSNAGCGIEFFRSGIGPHRAACKKRSVAGRKKYIETRGKHVWKGYSARETDDDGNGGVIESTGPLESLPRESYLTNPATNPTHMLQVPDRIQFTMSIERKKFQEKIQELFPEMTLEYIDN